MIRVCNECETIFEPVATDEMCCWVCQLQEEIEYAAENGYLQSGYYADDEFYVGSDATDKYWGENTGDEINDIPF